MVSRIEKSSVVKVRGMVDVLKQTIYCAIAISMPAIPNAVGETELYEFPDDAPVAADFNVAVSGKSVFVYDTRVAAIATFGMEGETVVRIERKGVESRGGAVA